MSNPTTIKDVLELLKTSTWDVASEQILSANAYKVEDALATIEQLVLERVIGSDLLMDSAMNAAVNGVKEYQRQPLTQLLRGYGK